MCGGRRCRVGVSRLWQALSDMQRGGVADVSKYRRASRRGKLTSLTSGVGVAQLLWGARSAAMATKRVVADAARREVEARSQFDVM